ncbi:MAG: leucyl aminopeptidase [Planctomycetes bacterium]|jgi:leucyl aminopeptidase|nr:leucyl aminopeptidase [Planctomycetota bacterium]
MKIRHVQVAAGSRGEVVYVLAVDGTAADAGPQLQAALAAAKATGDLKPTFRSVAVFHQGPKAACQRLAVAGLGKAEALDAEKLRRIAAVVQAHAAELGVTTFSLLVPSAILAKVGAHAAGAAIAEGLHLGAYRYEPPRQQAAKPAKAQQAQVAAVGFASKDEQAFAAGLEFGGIGAVATVFARDLENMAANLCTPSTLAKAAKKLAGGRLRVKVLDTAQCEKLGMGSFLGVARGSTEPPKFLVLEYRVPGAKQNVCVVGKGLTFDTGGISIKPAAKMDEMRYDMCGAGAVLGLFHALQHGGLGERKPKSNIIGLIAATENCVGPDAQKPGDVVTAMDGHTIEVLNTDAEGRLVLADAICYGKKFYRPAQIVDLATLTGAVVVALGHEVAGIMGNDQKLCDALIAAGKQADEPLWQLPLWDCHKEQMKSKFADLANINGGQHGNGSIAGGAFLSYFAGDTPWVHLDIAGTAYGGLAKDYYKSGAAGTAVRTLLHWVRSL